MDPDERLFALFDDLEQQARALYDAERAAELADRSRSEYAAVTLVSRLMASTRRQVSLDVAGVGALVGRLRCVGADWCLVDGAAQAWVVRLEAVRAVECASARSVPEVAWSPVDRLGLGSALRRLADTGAACRVHGVDGTTREGVLGRVGADFLELTLAPGRVVLVARRALAAVQSRSA